MFELGFDTFQNIATSEIFSHFSSSKSQQLFSLAKASQKHIKMFLLLSIFFSWEEAQKPKKGEKYCRAD